ncbi:Sec-independent protein translocase subunit TatA [Cellulomonas sp.]|uniref:Sec-independent protein translocase subunit TatA n=1 Tax=Cellulomonas sp. TaxID=40001 RepID=UPI003BACD7CF
MFRNITAVHVLIVLLVVVLLFGAKRLPDLAKSVGQSMKIFKSEVKDLRDDETPATPSTPVPPAVVTPAGVTPVGAPPVVPPVVESQYVTPVRPVEEPSEGHAPPKA